MLQERSSTSAPVGWTTGCSSSNDASGLVYEALLKNIQSYFYLCHDYINRVGQTSGIQSNSA